MTQVPSDLVSRRQRVVRPRDLRDRYVNPTVELSRLEKAGAVQQVAYGYYVVVPGEWLASPAWRPELEPLSLAVAVADYGFESVALMGISAARLQRAVPRALGVGSVAVPKQRPDLDTRFGRIVFHKRSVDKLALRRVQTDLATGYQTTAEQTVLDLVRFRNRWPISKAIVDDALQSLLHGTDLDKLGRLASVQRCRWALEELDRLRPDRDRPS